MRLLTYVVLAASLVTLPAGARAIDDLHRASDDGRYQLADMQAGDVVSRVLLRIDTWTGKTWRAKVEPGGLRWVLIPDDSRPAHNEPPDGYLPKK